MNSSFATLFLPGGNLNWIIILLALLLLIVPRLLDFLSHLSAERERSR